MNDNDNSSSIIISCDTCVMRATDACGDCVVTHVLRLGEPDAWIDGHRGAIAGAIVFDMAEQRAVRLFAEAGLVPTLRHRAAANS